MALTGTSCTSRGVLVNSRGVMVVPVPWIPPTLPYDQELYQRPVYY